MKSKGLVKIIVCSIVAVLLLGLLIGAMCYTGTLPFPNFGGATYSEPESYTVGNGSITGELENLEINWIGGTANVQAYDGDEIVIREGEIADRDNMLRFRLRDGTLTVQTRKSSFWGIWSKENKDLEILIPQAQAENLKSIRFNTASADLRISGITAQSFSVDAASGDVYAENCTFTSRVSIDSASGDCIFNGSMCNFDMDTASGSAELHGIVSSIRFDSASGDLKVDSTAAPTSIQFDSASGICELLIPADANFTADLDSASGDLYIQGFLGGGGGDRFVAGSGKSSYDFSTASGDVTIRAK